MYITFEFVPGVGWVSPGHLLHPDYEKIVKKGEKKK
jgi:hypothetical protein